MYQATVSVGMPAPTEQVPRRRALDGGADPPRERPSARLFGRARIVVVLPAPPADRALHAAATTAAEGFDHLVLFAREVGGFESHVDGLVGQSLGCRFEPRLTQTCLPAIAAPSGLTLQRQFRRFGQ